MEQYVFVGPHPDTLGNGTPLQLDQVVQDVNPDDPHDQALIAKGWLVKHISPSPPRPKRPRGQTATQEAE